MFSEERKLAVCLLYAHLGSVRKTANILRVSKSSVQRWVVEEAMKRRRQAAEATVEETPIIAQRPKPKLLSILHLVDIALKSNPFQTSRLLTVMLLKKHDIKVSKELVRVAIKNLGYTRKKARFYGLAKNALALNRRFIKLRNHYIENGHPIYSIDETGFGRFSYNRAYGYAKRGTPLYIRKQKARMTSISVLACASKDGWTGYKQVTGGVNRIMFSEFIKSLNIPKGAIMLLDNASIHKGDLVKEVLGENGIIPLYVPPYSPWYNPIEKCFSIVKRNFVETQDVDSAMQHLSSETHFRPFFEKTLSCNGFDEADAEMNLKALTEEEEKEATRKAAAVRRKPTTPRVPPNTEKTENTVKSKNEQGDTITVKTITTTVTTIRKKPIMKPKEPKPPKEPKEPKEPKVKTPRKTKATTLSDSETVAKKPRRSTKKSTIEVAP